MTTTTTGTKTRDHDLAAIAASYDDCPDCTERAYEALKAILLAMPEDKPVRWSTLRRRLPADSPLGTQAATALLKLCDEGVAVLLSGPTSTWVARADDFDKVTAQLPRPGGKTANAFDYR